jgi:hypothetical protein
MIRINKFLENIEEDEIILLMNKIIDVIGIEKSEEILYKKLKKTCKTCKTDFIKNKDLCSHCQWFFDYENSLMEIIKKEDKNEN